jgi:hypothetical protein
MFIGHFGVAFGAKRAARRVSLGTLFAACQFADLLWPSFLLLGIEHVEIRPGITVVTPLDFTSYPYSHSLVALVMWAALFGTLYVLLNRWRLGAGVTIAALVLSHWVLDVLVHRPDMPITLGGPTRLGFGLWNSLPATLIAEFCFFTVGVWTYARETTARDRVGSAGFASLVGFLVVVYVVNIVGPPPPNVRAVAWAAQAMWLLVAWAYWIDRHRIPVPQA